MLKPLFKGSEQYPTLPWRELLREILPPGQAGYVVEDIDVVLLRFGPAEGRQYDADGRFMLIEIKERSLALTYPQSRVLGLLHKLCRKADPKGEYYIGCYLWVWESDIVNGQRLSKAQIKDFLMGKIEIPSLFEDK